MKGVLAVTLLISAVSAEPFWGDSWFNRFDPSRRVLPPKPMHMHDMHNHDFGEPVHAHSPRCQVLQNLFSFKHNTMPSCTLASVCRDPGTGAITISELTESQMMTLQRPKQENFQNEMGGNKLCPCNEMSEKTQPDDVNNNDKSDNNSRNVEKDIVTSPTTDITYEPVINTSPRYHGGEGSIDIRIGLD